MYYGQIEQIPGTLFIAVIKRAVRHQASVIPIPAALKPVQIKANPSQKEQIQPQYRKDMEKHRLCPASGPIEPNADQTQERACRCQ